MLPAPMIQALGRLQFKHPALAWLSTRLRGSVTDGVGTIKHGVGAGLQFNAAGGFPGYILGTAEPGEQALLERHLRPADVVYDIGANIGFFSTLAARLVGPTGSVWAFEPFPESAKRARSNAALNAFDHVTVVEAAVGAKPGRMHLSLREHSALHRLASDGDGPVVEVIALDDWQATMSAPTPTFVMIDVEGAEIDVLDGMLGLLASCHPVISCEVHWLGHVFHEYVAANLAPLGYKVTVVDGDATGFERWHALLVAT